VELWGFRLVSSGFSLGVVVTAPAPQGGVEIPANSLPRGLCCPPSSVIPAHWAQEGVPSAPWAVCVAGAKASEH